MTVKEHPRFLARLLFLAALFAVGLWLRNLETRIANGHPEWRPWRATPVVTLYFDDGRFLFPVSRRVSSREGLAQVALQSLLDGPRPGSGLRNSIPSGVQIRSLKIQGGVAHINLSWIPSDAAQTAIIETMTALRGIGSVELSVDGQSRGHSATRIPLIYFASANGLVAIPTTAAKPREALERYLAGPPAPDLTGLPPDVQLLAHEYDSTDGLLTLKFSYTPSLRAAAIERPERMRTVLLGLIATLTEFPEVRAVQLDFGGQTRLGLGQCSDLLRTPQPRPTLLNDERLL
jgi:spore germination protein GerM